MDPFPDYPTECWLLHGTLSNGSPFYSRRFDPKEQARRAARMNSLGATVVVTRQIREGLVWKDAEAEAVR